MPTPKLSDELAKEAADAFDALRNKTEAALLLGIPRTTLNERLKIAAERGMCGTKPVLPGFAIKSIASKTEDGAWVKQVKAPGEVFEMPEGFAHKRISNLSDGQGRTIARWDIVEKDKEQQLAVMRAAVEAFKDELPRASPVAAPSHTIDDLLNQYTITDHHLGALAWNEETLGGDYDLHIGEQLIIDWFAAAIAQSPPARRAVFAQLGDFLHYDSFKSITPEHGNLLDSDSRYPKMVRAAIRIVRKVIRMLLEKHEQLDVIMCDANHDPAGEVWLREMMAAFYDEEPRIKVDTNPGTYSVIEHGDVSLFYHHGHRRGVKNVDSILVGKFRKVYGRTAMSYAHTGHKHSDELRTTDLMKVEQHETLAAPDAYGSNWLSGRSAKVITYHKNFGEDGRVILSAARVMRSAANDNEPVRMAA
ncbi:helix-turn-helix domain-containing protein [Rhizobium laguerreae]|uniref:helix-turn-helix domain-containing protein n=1 Tax=Rhizobium laguerreae TaxID=1076926 RepID=UPI001FE76A71|nr:helix-turn-helix domain-containing protein [Rhizobium laguerreae]